MKQQVVKKPKSNPKNNQIKRFFSKIFEFLSSKRGLALILALFAVQAAMLVFVTEFGVPPDERNHINHIQFFAENSPGPVFSEQTPTVHLGDKTREVDYLYHFIMSWVVRLLPLPESAELYVVRLLSVGFAVFTLIMLVKLLRSVGVSQGASNAAVLIISNLAMVLMMSSAINNDVLVWLGVISGSWLLVRMLQKPTALNVLGLLTLSIYGGLFKRNLLPICLVFGILASLHAVRLVVKWIKQHEKPQWRWQYWLIVGLLLIGVGLFSERVIGNLVTYGKITVRCEQIHGDKACEMFWANKREVWLRQRQPDKMIPIPEYVARWFNHSIFNILDIQTQFWRHEKMPPVWLQPFLLIVAFVGLGYGVISDSKNLIKDRLARWRLLVLLIGLGYMGVLWLYNYLEFLEYRQFGLALNGRYILPAVMLLTGLISFYWARWLKRWPWAARLLAVLVVASLVFGSGFALLMRNPQLWTR